MRDDRERLRHILEAIVQIDKYAARGEKVFRSDELIQNWMVRGSSFQDTTYLARQVFAFSCHSWRSFFPAPMPVTILYSELIAKMLGQLATIPRWNPDVMLGRIGTTRWFL